MDQVPKLATFIIATGSLVLSIFALWFNRRRWSHELYAPFIERIVDRRMASYPELWRITSSVYKQTPEVTGEHFSADWARDFLREISEWYCKQGHGIFMNQDSREAFLRVHEALWAFRPGEGRDHIKARVDMLRAEMRKDLKVENRGKERLDV